MRLLEFFFAFHLPRVLAKQDDNMSNLSVECPTSPPMYLSFVICMSYPSESSHRCTMRWRLSEPPNCCVRGGSPPMSTDSNNFRCRVSTIGRQQGHQGQEQEK
ncbi:hypothetical protein BDN72DRAFT_536214 [Pluteus cervinus]|uniref:Uncharacterized protein n=1 Tax=Pluteus cervinus TaxID=181527 RepID=A0ACD3AXF6_9AGAR|nr:hypothetical protein BDN72DRAFT_536214 [Pluteus cervinus]